MLYVEGEAGGGEMNPMTKNVVEPLHTAAFGLPVSPPGETDSRALLRRCLLDTVLPAVALLSMSVLTVAMIVVVVTTVAHGGWLTPATYVSVDPWSGVYPDSDALHEAGGPQRDSAALGDVSSQARTDAGYFAAETPE